MSAQQLSNPVNVPSLVSVWNIWQEQSRKGGEKKPKAEHE